MSIAVLGREDAERTHDDDEECLHRGRRGQARLQREEGEMIEWRAVANHAGVDAPSLRLVGTKSSASI
jgi:hypothetical protein